MFLRRLLSWIDMDLDLILLFVKNVISNLSALVPQTYHMYEVSIYPSRLF